MFKDARDREDIRERLGKVRVLIADGDSRTAELVRRVLYSFGFRHIFLADGGQDALRLLRVKKIDLMITESRLSGIGGAQLVKTIRGFSDEHGIRRDIPIIMLTAEAELPDVRRARDAGITEFLVKPFTAKTLSHRIIQVIDHPRIFVDAPNYAGPCRRRKRPAPEGKERRNSPGIKHTEEVNPTLFAGIPAAMTKLESHNGVSIYAPNIAIRSQLGAGFRAAEALGDETVAEAQNTLLAAEDEYVVWAREDIARLEAAYRDLQQRPTDPMAHHLLLTSAYAIKAQAGIFGYDLGGQIGKLLVEYLQQNPVMDENRLVVVRKHIDVINVIFTRKVKDSGDALGRELLLSLEQLIQKLG